MTTDTKLLTQRALRDRYGRCAKTILRWRKLGILPAPDAVIRGEPYWRESVIVQLERDSLAST
jgi:hypothetical protein